MLRTILFLLFVVLLVSGEFVKPNSSISDQGTSEAKEVNYITAADEEEEQHGDYDLFEGKVGEWNPPADPYGPEPIQPAVPKFHEESLYDCNSVPKLIRYIYATSPERPYYRLYDLKPTVLTTSTPKYSGYYFDDDDYIVPYKPESYLTVKAWNTKPCYQGSRACHSHYNPLIDPGDKGLYDYLSPKIKSYTDYDGEVPVHDPEHHYDKSFSKKFDGRSVKSSRSVHHRRRATPTSAGWNTSSQDSKNSLPKQLHQLYKQWRNGILASTQLHQGASSMPKPVLVIRRYEEYND